MNRVKMSEEINGDRCRIFGTAVAAVAAAQFGMTTFANAQSSKTRSADPPTIKPRTNSSFASVKKFSGKYSHRIVNGGVGHNLLQDAPQAFAKAIVDVDAFDRP
jgi:hypothetical protein